MAVIPAQMTVDSRLWLPQMWGGLATFKPITMFRIGEGGWIDPGTGREPRTPVDSLRRLDNNLQDLDCIVDGTRAALDQRYAADERYYFQKTVTTADMSFISPSKLEVRCKVEATEANDDGFGNAPEFWEIALYSEHPQFVGEYLMVAYGTFPQQTKTSAYPLLNLVRIVA